MKKVYMHYVMLLATVLTLGACNNEWEDELFNQSVSFVKNDVTDVYVRYKPNGKVTYQLPVIISGSTTNSNDLTVQVALDPDTLETLNFERFRYRDDLYFLQLEQNYYDIPEMSVQIPSGQNTALLEIDFSLQGLDLVRQHVLPLTISEGGGYVPNYRKHYRKSLLHVIPFNDYSGSYSATTAYIYDRTKDDSKQTAFAMGTRMSYVVDEKTIFFYAGATDEDLRERADYKVQAKFIPVPLTEEEKALEENANVKEKGDLEMSGAANINFKQISGTYKIEKNMDAKLPYLQHIYVTLYFEYYYDDITNPQYPLEYKVKGSMIMERKRNINIPDEDQSFQW